MEDNRDEFTAAPRIYVGMDISITTVHACAVDQARQRLFSWSCDADPDAIVSSLRERGLTDASVGFETGLNSAFLQRQLEERGVSTSCLDARRVYNILSLKRKKTDRIDAHGIAEVLASGWLKPITLRSVDSQKMRNIIRIRKEVESLRKRQLNQLRGLFHTFGLWQGSTSGSTFIHKARTIIEENPDYGDLFDPIIEVYDALSIQIDRYDQSLRLYSNSNDCVKRLMTVPGVGPLTAISFLTSMIDQVPFKGHSQLVSYLGLCPRVHHSGSSKNMKGVGYTSDRTLRSLLFIAARSVITVIKHDFALKRWGLALKARIGFKRAAIAVARKIAIIMHSIVLNGTSFVLEPSGLTRRS